MRNVVLAWVGLLASSFLFAQRDCRSFDYQQQLIQSQPSLEPSFRVVDNFMQHRASRISSPSASKMITIPVVIHILYHYPSENISDELVKSQIAALNRDYRKQNADTTKIPPYF